MEEPAWRALSPKAQILYIWLKLEWKGARFNNNGKIRFSYRQACNRIGISINTVGSAFHELQAKGFIAVKVLGALGVEGEARGPSYELTELATPGTEKPIGRLLYKRWRPGQDFEVVKHNINNPTGQNGKNRTPSSIARRSRLKSSDVQEVPVTESVTPLLKNSDVRASRGQCTVTEMKTSLVAIPKGLVNAPDLSVMAGLNLCPLLSVQLH